MTAVELSADAATRRATEVLELIHENKVLRESLASMNQALRLEDEQWDRILGGADSYEGITLDDLQTISEEIRTAMVKSPMIDRGANLRASYISSKGINFPEAPIAATKPGPKSKDVKAFDAFGNPVNQRYVFQPEAWEEMARTEYSDGNFFLLGDEETKELRRVPLKEITNFITNPDFSEEIWAWRRTWESANRSGKTETKSVWYYTDDCPAPIKDRAKTQIQGDKVDHGKTFIVQSVNRMVGWALGIPDAIAVVAWAKLYSEFLKHGYVMSRALASIAFKATSSTKTGSQNAALQFASPQGSGSTAVMGAASELTSMPTAGKGYDFDSGRPIAAMVATGVQVSIVHLLSDPGAAGSSYGSASNLDKPTMMAIKSRQQSWSAYFVRILKWLGFEDPKVTFPPIEDADFYREVQSILLGWSTGLLHEGEVRTRLLELLNIITQDASAPTGVMLPNNENSILRPDVDGDGTNTSTASPDQGRSSGAGSSGTNHVTRDDTIGEVLRQMETVDLLKEVMAKLEVLAG